MGSDLENRLSHSKQGGTPLPDHVQAFMGPRLGVDLSPIRVHTDSSAVQMNRDLGAQAFAHGNHVYYGAGKGPANDHLTAHELTHTIQQGSVGESSRTQIQRSPPQIQRQLNRGTEDSPSFDLSTSSESNLESVRAEGGEDRNSSDADLSSSSPLSEGKQELANQLVETADGIQSAYYGITGAAEEATATYAEMVLQAEDLIRLGQKIGNQRNRNSLDIRNRAWGKTLETLGQGLRVVAYTGGIFSALATEENLPLTVMSLTAGLSGGAAVVVSGLIGGADLGQALFGQDLTGEELTPEERRLKAFAGALEIAFGALDASGSLRAAVLEAAQRFSGKALEALEAIKQVFQARFPSLSQQLRQISGQLRKLWGEIMEGLSNLTGNKDLRDQKLEGRPGDLPEREIGANVDPGLNQAAQELGDEALEVIARYDIYDAPLSKEQLEGFIAWESGITDETRDLLSQDPELAKTFAQMDPQLRDDLLLEQLTAPTGSFPDVWSPIEEVLDDEVIKQLSDVSCGSACAEMLLRDRGITDISQEAIETLAGAPSSTESLVNALNELASSEQGKWVGGYVGEAVIPQLNTKGSWMAMMYPGGNLHHMVIIDGFDETRRLMIRDPWDQTRYVLSFDEFNKYWTGVAIFRQ